MQLFKKTNFDFVGKRYHAYAFSVLLLGIGLASLVVKKGPRLGIDFTGGSLVQLAFEQKVPMSELRKVLSDAGYTEAELQDSPDSKSVMIRIKQGKSSADSLSHDLHDLLVAKLPQSISPDPSKAIERAEFVGPSVGNALADQARNAVLWAAVLIILYVAFRFKSWLWGFCSIAAVVHDVFSVVGIFSLLNKEVTVTVVAGMLTLAGYSMNDTIVIYDRMRENLRLSRKESLADIINRSINETLSRTVMTSMTVMLALLVLFFFGGEVIHDFAFAMLWGVIVGSYSTIFVAAPMIYEWQSRQSAKRVVKK